jgi:smad nuclear-interacting protein 1
LHRAKHERRNEGNRYDRHRNRDGRDYCEDRHRSSHRYDKSGRDYQRSQSSRSQSPPPARALLPSGSESNDHESDAAPIEKPNYTPTGLLARAQNTVISTHAKAGTVSKETHIRKYTEPADAAPFAPSTRQISEQTKYEGATSQYRLVRFAKHDNTPLENIRLDQQTSYLVGTDPVLSHIPLSNTKSAEEQHAVIQYRLKVSMDKYGDTHRQIKPYLIDLDSEEGTSLNRDLIPSSRYVELRHKDLLEFGKDGHEYVFIQETTS